MILSQLLCSLSVAICRLSMVNVPDRRCCLIIFCPWMSMNVSRTLSLFKKWISRPEIVSLSFFFYFLFTVQFLRMYSWIIELCHGCNCPTLSCLYTQCRRRFSNRQGSDVRKKWTNDEEEDGAITVLFSRIAGRQSLSRPTRSHTFPPLSVLPRFLLFKPMYREREAFQRAGSNQLELDVSISRHFHLVLKCLWESRKKKSQKQRNVANLMKCRRRCGTALLDLL